MIDGGGGDGGELTFNTPCFLAKCVLRKYLLQKDRSQSVQNASCCLNESGSLATLTRHSFQNWKTFEISYRFGLICLRLFDDFKRSSWGLICSSVEDFRMEVKDKSLIWSSLIIELLSAIIVDSVSLNWSSSWMIIIWDDASDRKRTNENEKERKREGKKKQI